MPDIVRCPECDEPNYATSAQCGTCGQALVADAPQASKPAGGDDVFSSLVPYKNSKALTAYYLGVFGLVPCLGIPLAVAAIVLGVMGRNYVKEHAEAKGGAHAWAGIILGSLEVVGNVVGFVLLAKVK